MVAAPSMPRRHKIGQIGSDAERSIAPAGDRLQNVAPFAQHPLARIDEDRAGGHRGIIRLPHVPLEGADQIDMRTRLQPRTLDEGRRRKSGRTDDVRLAHRRFQVARHMDPHPGSSMVRAVSSALAGIACPDRDVRDRVLARMGGDEMRREATRADHDHGLRTWPDEITAGQRRSCGCRAAVSSPPSRIASNSPSVRPTGDRFLRPPQPALSVPRKDRDHLQSHIGAGHPGRHQKQRRFLFSWNRDTNGDAARA